MRIARVFAAFVLAFGANSAVAQSFNIGANFQTVQGGSGGGSEALTTPPDTQGAAGQNHIMVLVNGRYKTFSKVGGAALQSTSDATFFSNAGFGGGSIAGDPRVQFDPLTGRWYALNFTGQATNNNIVLAISAGADPTGQWKSVAIGTSSGTFADFPTMGIDANGVYIATNNFNTGGQFQNVHLFTLVKNNLLWSGAGSPSTAGMTSFVAQSSNTLGFTLQATNNFDPNQSGANNRVISSFNSTNLRTFNIQGTGGTTTLGAGAFIAVNTMNSPPNANQQGGNQVDTGDNRLSDATMQVGNLIYSANSFDNGTGRSQIRFTVVNATTGALVQQGNISDPTLAYYYPSLAVNEQGHAVISFSGSSSTNFLSTYAAVSTASGTLAFGTPVQVSAGLGTYTGFDGTPYRWGDYSATRLDPADTGIFWTFQERSTATASQWATQATEIIPTVAGQVRWQAAANGAYGTSTNWFNGVTPGATDHVIYSRNAAAAAAAYVVTLPAGTTTNDRISVRQGKTTFNIAAGSTYQATNAGTATPSFAVSQHLGATTLNITGGGTLSTVHSTLAAGENGLTTNNISSATVNVDGSTWANSGDAMFGGSFTRSGGTATLNVLNGGTTTVGGVARFWTSTSGVNVTGGASQATVNVGGLRADSGVNPIINGTGANAVLNITNGLSQNYFGQINGSIVLNKTGAGVQTLSGSMNYTGVTTINGGRLNINGAKTGTGAVNVNSGGTLGGTGSVAGAVNVASGGAVSPGTSPGNLTMTGGLNMSAGTYEWELAALADTGEGTNYDIITLNGGSTVLGGTSQVQLAFIGTAVSPNTNDPFWNAAHQWRIVNLASGTLTGIFGGIANPSYSLGNFTLSGGNGGSVFLNFAPVPEPSTFLLVGTGVVGFVLLRRRRARAK